MSKKEKRYRRKPPRDGVLEAFWGVDENWNGPDIVLSWGEGCEKADLNLLHTFLASDRPRVAFGEDKAKAFNGLVWDKSLIKELEARGYDITTLRFSVRKKAK